MIIDEPNYVYVHVQDKSFPSIEGGALIGLTKVSINNTELNFLILLTNKITIKFFNLSNYDITYLDIKLDYFNYSLEKNSQEVFISNIETVIDYLNENKQLVDKNIIDISIYKSIPIYNTVSNSKPKDSIIVNKITEPSLFVIKRQLPLLSKEQFQLMKIKSHVV